ncbi:MAG: hypothetical protein ABWX61_01020 [Paenisporosarcina sp.]
MINQHLELIPIIQMENFQHLSFKGPFELLHLTDRSGHFRGEGYDIFLEAGEIRVHSMNRNELKVEVSHILHIEIRKSKNNE